jgi:magnesium transporter
MAMKGERMSTRFARRSSKKSGLPPGTLVHIGERKADRVRMELMDYDGAGLIEKEIHLGSDLRVYVDAPTVSWVNVTGLHDSRLIHHIGDGFNIHPLTLEDIVNTAQRPKMEAFENYLYVVLRMLSYDPTTNRVSSEQVSFILGKGYLLSFQEVEGDIFASVRERIRKSGGRIRNRDADYLLYALMDVVVDQYFAILETIDERLDAAEGELLDGLSPRLPEKIHHLKRECLYLSRQIWPLREVLARLTREKVDFIEDRTAIFFRDVYDHAIQVIEGVEIVRDLLSGILDLYVSMSGNRLNEVMKVLTLIATIFIPITFIAGVYGMNFKYMPELDWPWGYPAAIGVMAAVCGGMLVYFKKKKWL